MQRISNSKEANIYVKKKYVIILEPVISTSKIENETGAIIGSSYWEFREIRGGFTEIEWSKSKEKKKKRFGSNYREVRETGGSRNRDFSTVTALILKLYMNFKKPTLHVQQKPVYSNNGQGIYFSLAASNFNYDVCCISFSRLIRQAIPSRILECWLLI